MILWFLRFFSAFKDLEVACEVSARNLENQSAELAFIRESHAELKTENLRLQDRIEAATEDRAKLWNLVEQAQTGERLAYQMQINEEWQKRYGVTPHPAAPSIPEAQQYSPDKLGTFGRRRIIPSEAVAKATSDFWDRKRKEQIPVHVE